MIIKPYPTTYQVSVIFNALVPAARVTAVDILYRDNEV
jgi:hypothetical protein